MHTARLLSRLVLRGHRAFLRGVRPKRHDMHSPAEAFAFGFRSASRVARQGGWQQKNQWLPALALAAFNVAAVGLVVSSERAQCESEALVTVGVGSDDDNAEKPVELIDLVLEGSKTIESVKGKKVVLVIGATGAGKSTLVGYLIGSKMLRINSSGYPIQAAEVGNKWEYDPANTQLSPVIGHGEGAQTVHPQVFQSQCGDGLAYLDLAGIFENRGGAYEDWGPLSADLAIEAASQISAVLLTMQYSEFIKVGRQNPRFGALCTTLQKIISFEDVLLVEDDNQDLSKYPNPREVLSSYIDTLEDTTDTGRSKPERAITLVITHNERADQDEVRRGIQSQLEGTIRELKEHASRVDDSELSSLIESDESELSLLIREAQLLKTLARCHVVIAGDYTESTTYDEVMSSIHDNLQHGHPIRKSSLRFTRKGDCHRIAFENEMAAYATEAVSQLDLLGDLARDFSDLKEAFDETLFLLESNPGVDISLPLSQDLFYQKEKERITAAIRRITDDKEKIDTDEAVLYCTQVRYPLSYQLPAPIALVLAGVGLRFPVELRYPDPDPDPRKGVPPEFIEPVEVVVHQPESSNPDIVLSPDHNSKFSFRTSHQGLTELQVRVRSRDLPKNREKIKAYAAQIQALEGQLATLTEEHEAGRAEAYRRFFGEQKEMLSAGMKQLESKYEQHRRAAYMMSLFKHGDYFRFNKALSRFRFEDKSPPPVYVRCESDLESAPADLGPGSAKIQYCESTELSGHDDWKADPINPFLYAIMSQLSYCEPHSFFVEKDTGDEFYWYEKLTNEGWELLQDVQIIDLIKERKAEVKYHALVFVNQAMKHIVIAHQGTESLQSFAEADAEMLMQRLPFRYSMGARALTQYMMEHPDYSEYSISHTGHSLGGSLAVYASLESGTPAVIFDPYGVKAFTSRKAGELPMVTAFLSGVNVVNATSPQHGLLFVIKEQSDKVEEDESLFGHLTDKTLVIARTFGIPAVKNAVDILKPMRHSLKLHSMKYICRTFDTDVCLPNSLGFVVKWPSSVNDFLGLNAFTYDQFGKQNRPIGLDSITDQAVKAEYQTFCHTKPAGSLVMLPASHFPKSFIDYLGGRSVSDAQAEFGSSVLSDCDLHREGGVDYVMLTCNQPNIAKLICLKLYVDRKVGEFNKKNGHYDFQCLSTDRQVAQAFRESNRGDRDLLVWLTRLSWILSALGGGMAARDEINGSLQRKSFGWGALCGAAGASGAIGVAAQYFRSR